MKYSDVRLGMKVKITDPECGKYGGAPVGTVMTVTGLPDIGSDIFILSDGSGYWPTRFDPADQEFSVGDKVRVKYATYGCTEQDVGKVRTVLGVSKDTITLSVHGFVHRPEALELVKKVEVIEETYGQKQNKWLEENKVIVGSNVLVKRALEPSEYAFKLLSGWSDRLFVGDIIPEKTFNEIMVWLRRAGARLAKINKNTKQERGKNVESVHDVCSPNRRYCVDDPERALI